MTIDRYGTDSTNEYIGKQSRKAFRSFDERVGLPPSKGFHRNAKMTRRRRRSAVEEAVALVYRRYRSLFLRNWSDRWRNPIEEANLNERDDRLTKNRNGRANGRTRLVESSARLRVALCDWSTSLTMEKPTKKMDSLVVSFRSFRRILDDASRA